MKTETMKQIMKIKQEIEDRLDELENIITNVETDDISEKIEADDISEKIKIGDCKPGDAVRIGGHILEILDTDYQGVDGAGVFCLEKDVILERAFDETDSNDWRTSTLRDYLNNDYLKTSGGELRDSLILFERDLVSDDGLRGYCDSVTEDFVSLISCDEYRRYRQFISNKSRPWWALTPYSTPHAGFSRDTRVVYTDGSLHSSYAHYGRYGVSPVYVLISSLEVERITDDEEDEE